LARTNLYLHVFLTVSYDRIVDHVVKLCQLQTVILVFLRTTLNGSPCADVNEA